MLPSDRVLQHQYQDWNYQYYADLIHDLLQAEKNDELTIKNYYQRRVGLLLSLRSITMRKKASASKDSNPKKNDRLLGANAIRKRRESSQK
jgi:hypothetical protein